MPVHHAHVRTNMCTQPYRAISNPLSPKPSLCITRPCANIVGDCIFAHPSRSQTSVRYAAHLGDDYDDDDAMHSAAAAVVNRTVANVWRWRINRSACVVCERKERWNRAFFRMNIWCQDQDVRICVSSEVCASPRRLQGLVRVYGGVPHMCFSG